MTVQIQIRGDNSSNWTSANPILADREIGYDKDQSRFKVGDGVNSWNALPYQGIGTSFAGTNASGTLGTNGLSLSVAAGGGGGIAASLSGNTAGAMGLVSSGTMVLAGGNNITLSQNGQSITVSGPTLTNYLTTAALSNHSHNLATTTTTGDSIVVGTANSSGATIGVPAFLTTAQPVGAYLTTAAQSNHSHNFATTTTNGALIVVGTTNSNGATIGVPSFLTTAQPVGAYLTTARASNDAVGLNTALTGNGVAWTVNSSGLSLNVPAFLTTAAQSNHSHNFATTTTNGGVIVVGTTNSAGATIGVPSFLTTARASTDAVGLNTAQSNVTWTANSSGISLDARGYAGTGTSATNASVTLNSNGLQISVAAPGGGAAINVSAGTTSNNLQTIQFDNSNGVSFGLNGSTITASAAAGGGGAATLSYLFLPGEDFITNLSAHANGTMSLQNKMAKANYTATQLIVPVNISSVATTANNSSAGINFTISFAIYTENANTLSSVSSTTFSTGATWTSNATASVTGAVLLTAPFNMNLTAGEYYLGINMSTAATGGTLTGAATTSLGNTISVMGMATANFGALSWHNLGAGTAQSTGWNEQGLYTGTTAFTGPINLANISMAGTAAQRANFAVQFRA